MAFPTELIDEPNDTAVIGDLEAFMAYVESGQAWHDWQELCTTAHKEFERCFQNCQRADERVGALSWEDVRPRMN
jgi:hypothetical protein